MHPTSFLDWCDAAILTVITIWCIMDRFGIYFRSPK